MLASDLKPNITLQLRSEPSINLTYHVEIVEDKQTIKLFSSENYFQALLIAKRIFNDLRSKYNQIGDVEVIIESLHGRGACYEINDFSFDASFEDTDNFYQELVSEFEIARLQNENNLNVVFRKLIDKHKLNEYQEQRFLTFIRKINHG